MPSPLARRMLATVPGNGFAKAKKLADLALKTNVNDKGQTTVKGYQQAMEILQPYLSSSKEVEAIDAQRIVAGYNNSIDKLSVAQRDQNQTVSDFKMAEQNAYFTQFEGDDNGQGGMRDPAALISGASEALDKLLYGVANAISDKEANNESTDSLYKYLDELQGRAESMRDLYGRFTSGALPEGQSLDGFGYYVETNPIDGSIRRAGILPVGNAPEGMGAGFKRLEATTKVGGSLLPVYAPAQQKSSGEYVAKVGDATWTGTGAGALTQGNAGNAQNLFKEGEFNISDKAIFQSRKNTLEKGDFGAGIIGVDDQGNAIEATFFRGHDGKLYNVDQATRDKFSADPILSQKLNGYMQRFSPSEMKSFVPEATSIMDDRISNESRLFNAQDEAAKAKAESDRMENMGFFSKLGMGFNNITKDIPGKDILNKSIKTAFVSAVTGPMVGDIASKARFFDAKNTQNTPEQPSIQNSTADLVDKGKSFFRNVYNKVVNAK